MENSGERFEQDETGQWWYRFSPTRRVRCTIAQCVWCGNDFPTYRAGRFCSRTCANSESVPRRIRPAAPKPPKVRRIRGRVFTDEERARIRAGYEAWDSLHDIAGSIGTRLSTISRLLREMGLPPRKARNTKQRLKTRYERPDGYVQVWKDGRWQKEHRIVMEATMGRPLLHQENVHHINGVKNDNRPENLELWQVVQPTGRRAADPHCATCSCFEAV